MVSSLTLRLRIYLSILLVLFIAGIIGLMVIEHLSPLDAFYFIVVTIATVGYGDIHPVTPEGKLLVIVIILTGVSCFVGLVANAIEYMIDERERTQRLEKLNMIIGVFFSEVGIKLLKKFNAHDPEIEKLRAALVVSNNWSESDFAAAAGTLKNHVYQLNSRTIPLEDLHGFLTHHKRFLLALLENPQMIEHDSFTPLLQAVFHLTEELIARDRLTDLPSADYDHLSADINRVYRILVIEWLTYMKHLKQHYPYLFSLAMRTNPFDANATPFVH